MIFLEPITFVLIAMLDCLELVMSPALLHGRRLSANPTVYPEYIRSSPTHLAKAKAWMYRTTFWRLNGCMDWDCYRESEELPAISGEAGTIVDVHLTGVPLSIHRVQPNSTGF